MTVCSFSFDNAMQLKRMVRYCQALGVEYAIRRLTLSAYPRTNVEAFSLRAEAEEMR